MKRQHYVPEFYLKGFTDINNIIWCYNFRRNKDSAIHHASTKDVAVKKYFYYPNKDIIENGGIIKILKKIRGRNFTLSKNDEKFMKIMVDNFMARTEVFREISKFMDRKKMGFTLKENFKESNIQFSIDDRFLEQINRLKQVNLLDSLETDKNIHDFVLTGYYFLINNTKVPFITSDAPAVQLIYPPLLENKSVNFNSYLQETIEKMNQTPTGFPIDPYIYLIIGTKYEKGETISVTNENIIRSLNSYQSLISNTVISNNKEVLSEILDIDGFRHNIRTLDDLFIKNGLIPIEELNQGTSYLLENINYQKLNKKHKKITFFEIELDFMKTMSFLINKIAFTADFLYFHQKNERIKVLTNINLLFL